MAVKIVGKPKENQYVDHLTDDLHASPGMGKTSLIIGKGKEAVTEHKVSEPALIPQSKRAVVTVAGGLTINLGDFNNAKVYVSVALPCSEDELEETYAFAVGWVDSKISEAQKMIKG